MATDNHRQTRRLAEAMRVSFEHLGTFQAACDAFKAAHDALHHPTDDEAEYDDALKRRDEARAAQLRLIDAALRLTRRLERDLPKSRIDDDTTGRVRRLLKQHHGFVKSKNNPFEYRGGAFGAVQKRWNEVEDGIKEAIHDLCSIGAPVAPISKRRPRKATVAKTEVAMNSQNRASEIVEASESAERPTQVVRGKQTSTEPDSTQRRSPPMSKTELAKRMLHRTSAKPRDVDWKRFDWQAWPGRVSLGTIDLHHCDEQMTRRIEAVR